MEGIYMSDIKLFKINGARASELASITVFVEKELQSLIETNMQDIFGVRFLFSEYSIDAGRIDSLGIDENNCPIIF
jgi:RecB family endonuclease NucS